MRLADRKRQADRDWQTERGRQTETGRQKEAGRQTETGRRRQTDSKYISNYFLTPSQPGRSYRAKVQNKIGHYVITYIF